MSRKWRCNQAAGGARAPPNSFPAVCPCGAVCAALSGWVASLPPQPGKAACRGPVAQRPQMLYIHGTRLVLRSILVQPAKDLSRIKIRKELDRSGRKSAWEPKPT